MQSYTRLKILIVGACVVFSGAMSVAEAAPIHQFDVGYGWDGAFAYGQAETPPSSETPQASESEAVVDTLDVPAVASRKTATVPVPGSLALFGSGLVLLAVAGRRSRRRASVAY